jgi:dihydrofolate synthase/folylpolyglutamate synthase
MPHRYRSRLAGAHRARCMPAASSSGWNASRRSGARSGPSGLPVITVGGTNGKGSTCAMLERILLAPAIASASTPRRICCDYNERVRIDGRLSTTHFCAAFAAVERRAATPADLFRVRHPGGLAGLRRAEVDVIILEVGLGGRLDAVNVFDADCAIVTSVASTTWTSSATTARPSASRRPASSAPAGRPSCGDPQPPQAARARAGDRRRCGQGRDFGYRRPSSGATGLRPVPGPLAAAAGWPIRRCAAPTSWPMRRR